ncbi:MAG TPA: TonB family protein [Allosphingosinicella sp.]|nr:TonB family protein [Allosphingosinicella sp.]
MSALAMAMLLTGAGDVQRQRPPRNPPPPVMVPMMPPVPPAPYIPPPVMVPPPPAPPVPAATPPQRARANLASYFSEDDYPAAALRAHDEGTTGFQLTIGPNGRVTDCQVTASSGSSALDSATCRIMRSRARYTPARGYDGNPTIGRDAGRVTWRLPEEEGRAGLPIAARPARLLTLEASRMTAADFPRGVQPAGAQGSSGLRVAIGRTGRVIGCDVPETSGAPALDAAACRLYAARARYEPARDLAGAAICDVDWLSVDWPAAGAIGQPAARRAPASPAPGPLRGQLNATLCPGWSPR